MPGKKFYKWGRIVKGHSSSFVLLSAALSSEPISLRRTVFCRSGFVDGDDSLREEAFMPSEQFVHYTDADPSREADFLIQFHVYV